MPRSQVAIVADVAGLSFAENSGGTDDLQRLSDLLKTAGPITYGAAAVALGWGATQAWQAEAQLRESGRATFDHLGRAVFVAVGPK